MSHRGYGSGPAADGSVVGHRSPIGGDCTRPPACRR
jgi:hypothetical protein